MNSNRAWFLACLLLLLAVPAVHANRETDQELYSSNRFAIGIGAAIVKFDTKLKFTDKTRTLFNSIFIDPEGTLGLPETSSVTTFYGVWNINPRHSLFFSYFGVTREASLFDIDETFEDLRVQGNAKITDSSSFYRFGYGYTLFDDHRSKIKLHAGICGLDLDYEFEASGQLTLFGITASESIK